MKTCQSMQNVSYRVVFEEVLGSVYSISRHLGMYDCHPMLSHELALQVGGGAVKGSWK